MEILSGEFQMGMLKGIALEVPMDAQMVILMAEMLVLTKLVNQMGQKWGYDWARPATNLHSKLALGIHHMQHPELPEKSL